MKLLHILTLVIVTMVLMVIIPLSFFLYSINQTLLKPYALDEYITKVELSELLSDHIQERFEDVDHPLKDEYEEVFISTLQDALDEAVTPVWVNDKLNEMQVNVWDFLLEVTETIEPIHITELKESIILEFQLVLDDMGYPEEQASRFIDEMENQVPEALYINDVLPMADKRSVQVKNAYQQTQQGYETILLLTVILFVIGLLLTFYPKTIMRWSGYVLGSMGLLTFLLISLLSKDNMEAATQTVQASTTMSGWGNGLSTLTAALLADIAEIMNPLALTLGIIGLLLVLFSHLSLIRRIDGKIRDFSHRHPGSIWIRAVMAVFFIAAAGWQFYQLNIHANAFW